MSKLFGKNNNFDIPYKNTKYNTFHYFRLVLQTTSTEFTETNFSTLDINQKNKFINGS